MRWKAWSLPASKSANEQQQERQSPGDGRRLKGPVGVITSNGENGSRALVGGIPRQQHVTGTDQEHGGAQ